MAYENNDRKFLAVINRKHSLPVILNALAHAAFGISAFTAGRDRLLDYPNRATGFVARINEYPFIILEAKNSSQLKTLVGSVVGHESIALNAFTTSMLGPSAEAQIQSTLTADGDMLDFVLVTLF